MINIGPEFDVAEPASRAESTELLIEVINMALHSDRDPWNTSDLFDEDTAAAIPDIEKGYIAEARSKTSDTSIICKFDPIARDQLLYGSEQKERIASLVFDDKTYDFYASTQEYHEDDALTQAIDIPEYDLDGENLEFARSFDSVALPVDFEIGVFENLPTNGSFLRTIGGFASKFSDVIGGADGKDFAADAEDLALEADRADSALTLELNLGASTIDGQTARALTAALREDFEAVIRY